MTATHPKGRRYSVPVMRRAIELRGDGWQLERVADFLEAEHGVRPSIDTIAIWTDPDRAETSRRSHQTAIRRYRNRALTGRMPNATRHTADFQEIRARELAAAGVLHSQIAKVMAFDYPGAGWTDHRVRMLLGPKKARLQVAA